MFDINAFMILYKKLLSALASVRSENAALQKTNAALEDRVKSLEEMLSEAMALGSAMLDEGGSVAGNTEPT